MDVAHVNNHTAFPAVALGTLTLPTGYGHRHPPQPEGTRGKGRAEDTVAQPNALAVAEVGDVLHPPSDVCVAAQKKSLLPKRDECEAQRKLISLSGSADSSPASRAKGKGDLLCGCKFFPCKHHQTPLFIWQTSNNTLSAAHCECRRLLALAPTGPPLPFTLPGLWWGETGGQLAAALVKKKVILKNDKYHL